MARKQTRKTVSKRNPQARTKGYRSRIKVSNSTSARIRTAQRRKR